MITEILKAILFGIVEGITEWLPVSSTGHMILLNEFLPLNVTPAFYELFEVVIQLGAALAVLILFWDKVWPFDRRNNRHPLAKEGIFSWVRRDRFELWIKIIIACIPAIVVGVFFDDILNDLFYGPVCVAIMLILVGVAFIVVENLREGVRPTIRSLAKLDYKTAAIIGLFQMIAAIFPGTSRSGATIIGALLLGVSRKVGVEFTFCLAIPVMFGASLLKIVKFEGALAAQEYVILITGMLVAFGISMLVIRKLIDYIKSHDFKPFGWYRIALGAVVLVYFLMIKG